MGLKPPIPKNSARCLIKNGEFMIEIKSSKVDKNLLREEIDNIIDSYTKNPQKREKIDKKSFRQNRGLIYQVEDFTKHHDKRFIKNLYRVVLEREIDEERLNQELELLRSGKRSKTELLAMVRFSKEGRERNVTILGIKKRYIMALFYRIPILSFFTKLFTLPRLIERINRFESHYFIAQQEQNNRIDTKLNIDDFQNDIDNTNEKLQEIELRIKEIKRAKESLKEMEDNLSTLVNNIKDSTFNQSNTIEILEAEKNLSLDSLYISFEDKFRGSRVEIKSKQRYYLPLIRDILQNIDGKVVDIGCGRGEWLELLKENSIRAVGVDLNRLMVQESKNYGLEAVYQDAISYLKSQEENSISIITGFHIVEHLPFEVLISLFDESLRVLKKGGAVIFETPNPENIMVGACNFYTDPTHINPIPPITLQFLAQNRGFLDVKIERLNPIKEPSFVDINNAQDINNLIFASTKEQDYAIIGYKI